MNGRTVSVCVSPGSSTKYGTIKTYDKYIHSFTHSFNEKIISRLRKAFIIHSFTLSFKHRRIFAHLFSRSRRNFEGWHSAPSWPAAVWRRCLLVWPFGTELIDRRTSKRGWLPAAKALPHRPRECRIGQSHGDL